MPKFSDFDARVLVDGTPLPEYAESKTVDAAGVTTVSCWVPSEAGKAFSVLWADARPPGARPSLVGDVYADGVFLGGRVAHAQEAADKVEIASQDVDGVDRAVVFSELDLTDDDSVLKKPTHEHMGEIHIRMHCVRLLGQVPIARRSSTLSSEKVHERSKKAGAHRIQLGAVLGAAPATAEKVELEHPMLVRFVFRYRPLALLQATDIVPLPPRAEAPLSQNGAASASRSPTREPVPHMSQEEADEERRLKARLAELKRKRGEAAAPGRKKVKTEVKAEPLSHTGRFTDGEVIDLSED